MGGPTNCCCRFDQLIEYGQKMAASNPRVRQVKDRIAALKQEKAALKDTWCERNDLLHEGQDLQVSCQKKVTFSGTSILTNLYITKSSV